MSQSSKGSSYLVFFRPKTGPNSVQEPRKAFFLEQKQLPAGSKAHSAHAPDAARSCVPHVLLDRLWAGLLHTLLGEGAESPAAGDRCWAQAPGSVSAHGRHRHPGLSVLSRASPNGLELRCQYEELWPPVPGASRLQAALCEQENGTEHKRFKKGKRFITQFLCLFPGNG